MIFRSLLVASLVVLAACSNANKSSSLPHLDLDEGSESLALVAENEVLTNETAAQQAAALKDIVAIGKRNLDWIKHINSRRAAGQQLSFSTKAGTIGYPMDKPSRYSDKLILEQWSKLKPQIPAEMVDVILNQKPFTNEAPIALGKYLYWTGEIDRVYAKTNRWIAMSGHFDELAAKRRLDIRGYYYLSREVDLNNKLANFKSLPQADHDRLKDWLILLCFNNLTNQSVCELNFKLAEQSGRLTSYFMMYNQVPKAMYENFFKISKKRTDIDWTSANPNILNYAFRLSADQQVTDFLKTNIEDEWRTSTVSLILKFTPNAATHVEFEPNVLPHVNGVAGSTITMDANAPLTEWGVQATIRHEFGHNLGFPDCYVEFYDVAAKEMVNYQIDTANIMCSRLGTVTEKHFAELKRVYFH